MGYLLEIDWKLFTYYYNFWEFNFNQGIKLGSAPYIRQLLEFPYELANKYRLNDRLCLNNVFFTNNYEQNWLNYCIQFLNLPWLQGKPYPIHVAEKMLVCANDSERAIWQQVLHDMIFIGCDVNMINSEDGNSLLHYASMVGSEELCSFLLKEGAHKTVTNYQNQLPCQVLYRSLQGGYLLSRETYLEMFPNNLHEQQFERIMKETHKSDKVNVTEKNSNKLVFQ